MAKYIESFSSSHRQGARTGPFPPVISKHDSVFPDRRIVFVSLHGSFFSAGKAVCLFYDYDVVQPYVGGRETWDSTHDAFFAKGNAVCLAQSFDVVQSYLQGAETWFARHDVIDGSRRDVVLLAQVHDTLLPDFHAAFSDRYDRLSLQMTQQSFAAGVTAWDGLAEFVQRSEVKTTQCQTIRTWFEIVRETTGAGFCSVYEIGRENACLQLFGYEVTCLERSLTFPTRYDVHRYRDILIHATPGGVVIDVFESGPRLVEQISLLDSPEVSRTLWTGRYDRPECAHACFDSEYRSRHTGRTIVYLQQEAICEYTATLVDVVTGVETTVASSSMTGFAESLAPHCTGDTEWEMELATSVRYYAAARRPMFESPVRWRFVSRENRHYRQAPYISALSVQKQDSSFELRFDARWPYEPIAHYVELFAFRPTEEEDFFDLGIWASDSFAVDTDLPPLLTLTYTRDRNDYFVHVPREQTTKFLAVAPIRRFPFVEIGTVTQIFIP